jgi:hypothetical protein
MSCRRSLQRLLLVGIPLLALSSSVSAQVSPGSVPAQPTGPVERTVVTGDGAMYRGEVVDYIVGDHITLKLDSGEIRRIPFADAAHISPPRPKVAAPAVSAPSVGTPAVSAPPTSASPTQPSLSPATTASGTATPGPAATPRPTTVASGGVVLPPPPDTVRTIVTREGLVFHGEVLEYDHGSHVTLKLANGEKRRILWSEAKKISPQRSKNDVTADLGSPERTVILRDGSTVKGDIVEGLITDHTTLRLPSGQIRTLRWSDIRRIMGPRPMAAQVIPTTGELLIHLEGGGRIQAEFFEYSPDEQLIVRLVAGGYRSLSLGQIKKIVILGENPTP